ncbi:MAG: hypothetical protein Ta2E_10780 [Mycoplasmoidaceae bacterium]|nr:MAG: hypothetical protein Ta2E_10780 [Mycoplasmoidaceae bacterium]
MNSWEIELLRAEKKYIQKRKDIQGIQLHLNLAEKENTDGNLNKNEVYLKLKKICEDNDTNQKVRRDKEKANDLSERIIECNKDLQFIANQYYEKNYKECYNKGIIMWNDYKLIRKKEFRELFKSLLYYTIDSMLNLEKYTMEANALLSELDAIDTNAFETRFLKIKLAILENKDDIELMPLVNETYIMILRKYNPANFSKAEEQIQMEELWNFRGFKTGDTWNADLSERKEETYKKVDMPYDSGIRRDLTTNSQNNIAVLAEKIRNKKDYPTEEKQENKTQKWREELSTEMKMELKETINHWEEQEKSYKWNTIPRIRSKQINKLKQGFSLVLKEIKDIFIKINSLQLSHKTLIEKEYIQAAYNRFTFLLRKHISEKIGKQVRNLKPTFQGKNNNRKCK